MLEGLFSTLNPAVPPVPSPKNQREPLEAANYAAVPLVPPVPPEKTKTKATHTKTATPATDDDRHYCRDCRHLSGSGYCIHQRFRPVDDPPRRCDDFLAAPTHDEITTF